MTDDERRNLKPGQRVLYVNDVHRVRTATVRHCPARLHDGTWFVDLDRPIGGFRCYRLDRIVAVVGDPQHAPPASDPAWRGDALLARIDATTASGGEKNITDMHILVSACGMEIRRLRGLLREIAVMAKNGPK